MVIRLKKYILLSLKNLYSKLIFFLEIRCFVPFERHLAQKEKKENLPHGMLLEKFGTLRICNKSGYFHIIFKCALQTKKLLILN